MSVTVLFGAGAEVSLGLPTGENFAKQVLGLDEVSKGDINEAIKAHFKKIVQTLEDKAKKSWYPEYNEYSYYDEDRLVKSCFKKKKLENDEFYIEDNITDFLKTLSASKRSEIINRYTSYMGLIDEHFHTLISPKSLGVKKFWNVISCYTRAYMYLSKSVIDHLEESMSYVDLLNNPCIVYEKWKEYAHKIKNQGHENYYSIIKDKKNIKIVTTNYTPLCEEISEIEDIAYIHGKFSWFEEPYEMKVYDVEEKAFNYPKDAILFPYITIQSGIKPIIEKRQLKEYSKMIRFLENSSTLIVLGFKLNCDDNHINSLIRDFIESNKKVIVFNYCKQFDKGYIERALRIKNDHANLEIVDINRDNSLNKFKECIAKQND